MKNQSNENGGHLKEVDLSITMRTVFRHEDGTELKNETRTMAGVRVRRQNIRGTRKFVYCAYEAVGENDNTHRICVNDQGDWYGAIHTRLIEKIVGIKAIRMAVTEQWRRAHSYINAAFIEASYGIFDEGTIELTAATVEVTKPDQSYTLVHSTAGFFEIMKRMDDHAHDIPGVEPLVFIGEYHNRIIRGAGMNIADCVQNYWHIGRAQMEVAMGGMPIGAL